ncbi:MAG: NFACT family protein [Synergistaceae bacterium]|jgi:predicted ribosome quality control (RQC) complex YloA/Tae2 family protein|nr:NFACT family protein [Synergistaceae bacterium]
MGPELVWAESVEISRRLIGSRIRRVESGDLWVALVLSREMTIFLSWDAEFYGVCSALPDEIRRLASAASARPPLADAVKSHLVGAEIVGCSAPGRDRVLRFETRRAVGAGFHQVRRLVIEASSRYSSILLLDEDERIVEAAKHIYPEDNRYRSSLPGGTYVPPPPVVGVSIDDWETPQSGVTETLERIVGLGKPLIAAIRRTCEESPGDMSDILSEIDFFKNRSGEAIYQSIGKYATLFPRLLSGAEVSAEDSALMSARRAVIIPLLNRHLDRFRKKISSRLDRLVSANEKKISEHEALLSDEDGAEKLKETGKLILANISAIPPRASKAELTEWTEAGEGRRVVELDPERDTTQNAERYFAKYRKRKAAETRAKRILPSLYSERDELSEQKTLLNCHDDTATLSMMLDELTPDRGTQRGAKKNSNPHPLPPHRRYEFTWADAVIFCGLSAKGNHYVTFRLAKSDDMWFHAQGVPGAHVILRFNSKLDDDALCKILETAAHCAAYHSGGRDNGRVRVDYTWRRHVRAIPGGGMAHVTYKEFSTITTDPTLWIKNSGL